ncbi:MAG: hypothetical protein K2N01_12020 [Lachnospiraceae bacterium]|nr:hypothetical protein [Lachnospiraceae bacterium]
MKRWKRFWKLRKQDDMVKIILIFWVFGMGCLIQAAYNGVLLYQAVQSPAEYVLMADTTDGALSAKQKELVQEEDVMAAGLWRQTTLTVKYQGMEAAFSCSELSEPYMETVYGIRDEGAMKTIYMNQKAFSQVLGGRDGSGYSQNNDANRTLRVTYVKEDQGDETSRQQTADIVLVKDGVSEEEPLVFCKGDRIDLAKYASGIRVYVGRHDLDGRNAEKLQETGFTIANMQEIREAEYLGQMKLVRIKYGVLTAALCLFCACVLMKFRRENRR